MPSGSEEFLQQPAKVSFTPQACTKRMIRLGAKATEPMITLTIGGDDGSQGVVIWAHVPRGNHYASIYCLQGVRWMHRVTDVEEMLTIAIQALSRARDERGWE